MTSPDFDQLRAEMVATQIEARGVTDAAVVRALHAVPRHLFVPPAERPEAYNDGPLTIGYDQTISQPYIVAYMTAEARLKATDRVLEIGTGCGYQTAVAAEIAAEVFTIEILEPLARQARETFKRLGYENIKARVGDGSLGWPEAAPFDVILVTACPERIPQSLLAQLAPGGRMIIPVGPQGSRAQSLMRVSRRSGGAFAEEYLLPVAFVPMTGRIAQPD